MKYSIMWYIIYFHISVWIPLNDPWNLFGIDIMIIPFFASTTLCLRILQEALFLSLQQREVLRNAQSIAPDTVDTTYSLNFVPSIAHHSNAITAFIHAPFPNTFVRPLYSLSYRSVALPSKVLRISHLLYLFWTSAQSFLLRSTLKVLIKLRSDILCYSP